MSVVTGVAPLSCRTAGTPGVRKSRAGESGTRGSARSPGRRYSTLCISLTVCGLSLFTGLCRADPVLCGPLLVIGDLLTFARVLITVNCAPLHYALRTVLSPGADPHLEQFFAPTLFLCSVCPLSMKNYVNVLLIILFIY